ncbi:NUDIX domain-containing protein [Paenibacillus mesophilus]|uniref:NUDIX hydrolase n=1 Tax=Paenibacillus mesophilus TaxID=2582849 RepID=UPI00110D5621|nr:NUDIX domain-containing protein [Paenibacillus mesophilus]TMV51970.1 NUDIX domain-containing protein [Paenibacillus mesophilus]
MDDYRYCPLCGSELAGSYIPGKSYRRCASGHFTLYPNQSVGAAAIITDNGRVLLERRAIKSGYGLWALPGGMAERGESIEHCVRREVREETGLDIEQVQLLDVVGGNRVCIVFYEAQVAGGELQKSEESLELAWFDFESVPFEHFAFPRHTDMLRKWMEKGEIRYESGQ